MCSRDCFKKMKEKSERQRNTGTKGKMAMNKYLSLVILDVNELNAPTKRYMEAEWVKKT